MKMKVSDFLEHLNKTIDGSMSKAVVDNHKHFVFVGNNLITSNDDVVFVRKTNFEFSGVPDVGINATDLLKFMSKIKTKEVSIEFTKEEMQASFAKDRMGIKWHNVKESFFDKSINTLISAVDFDEFERIELPQDFIGALRLANSCTANDRLNDATASVHFNENYVEATDNFQIARYQFDNFDFQSSFLIPSFIVSIIIKNEPKYMVFLKDDSRIYFMDEEMQTIFGCRTFGNEFYPIDELLREAQGGVDLSFGEDVINAVSRAKVFSGHDENGIRQIVDINISKDKLTIKTQKDEGWYEKTTELEYEGEPLRFRVDIDALENVLKRTCNFELYEKFLVFYDDNLEYVIQLMN
jgi:hypothetical protein